MSLRFIQISDCDLGAHSPFLGAAQSGRVREIQSTLEDAVSFAIDPENRIDGLLVVGNLFHRHNPGSELVEFWQGLSQRLADAKKLIVLSPGLQDSAIYKNSVYRSTQFPGTCLLLDTKPAPPHIETIRGTEVAFYAVAPEPGRPDTQFPGWQLCPEAQLHIGMVNGMILDHPEWEIRSRSLTIDPRVLENSGLDYVALGGYHGHTVLPLEGTTAAYAGSLEGLDFVTGDLGPRTLLVVEIDGRRNIHFERHAISRKILELITINLLEEGIRDAEGLLNAIVEQQGPDVMARVVLEGPLEFLCDFEALAAKVADRFAWLEIEDHTDLRQSALLRRIQGESTIRGLFARRMMKRLDELHADSHGEEGNAHRQGEKAALHLALRRGLEPFVERDEVEELHCDPVSLAPEPPAAQPNGEELSELGAETTA